MTMIALDQLAPHPGNSNRMPPALLAKLIAHIRATGRYPALIVRTLRDEPGRYQILDGHHRVEALRQLGHAQAACDVWEVDDQQASLLLLTLNRLRGEDDPHRRADLLKGLADSLGAEALAKLIPEDLPRLRAMLEVTTPIAGLAPPPRLDDMPQAVTFFLSAPQRTALLRRLREVDSDRSKALIALLKLDEAA